MSPVGVFGGTFDPIHRGHLDTVVQVQARFRLDPVYFVPAARPPHRGEPSASAAHRLAMLRLALAERPAFVADPLELERDGPSYTVDTLRAFRTRLGRRCPIALILGMDAFLGLPTWREWESILELAHLLVMRRPGWSPPDTLPAWWAASQSPLSEPLENTPAGTIRLVCVTPVDLSATGLRGRVRAGQSIDGLVPDAVAGYIQRHGLYR